MMIVSQASEVPTGLRLMITRIDSPTRITRSTITKAGAVQLGKSGTTIRILSLTNFEQQIPRTNLHHAILLSKGSTGWPQI